MNLFQHLVERHAKPPGASAFIFGSAETSYPDLLRTAEAAGSALRATIAEAGPIATIVTRPELRTAAVLTAAASGLPLLSLDPEWPATRVAAALEDFHCAGLLVDAPETLAVASGLVGGTHDIGSGLWFGRANAPAASSAWSDRLTAMQYLMFTSGSTGQPKAVGVDPDAALAHVEAVMQWLRLAPEDNVLQFARLAFDTSLEEIWPTLFAGATIVPMLSRAATFNELSATLRDNHVTVLQLPTAYWRQWAGHLLTRRLDLPSLRVVVIGGEAAYERDAHIWRSGALGSVRLINSYGPTEAGITASAYEVPATVPDTPDPLPIGSPLPGREFLLEERNATGNAELLIAGPTLASGYFTASGFVEDRFVEKAGRRWYRTGDMVRIRTDGAIVFAGRVDRQVKILGRRVELESIEASLLQGGATEARVEAFADDRGRLRLTAIVAGVRDETAFRAELAALLPPTLIPARILVVDDIAKNAAGKIDVHAARSLLRSESHA